MPCRECGALSAGGQRRPPLRMYYWWCVGEGLCPSRGRGRTPPLRTAWWLVRWADVGIGPYGSATRGAMGGRPQGSPLRRVTRSAVKRGVGEIGEAPPVAEEASRFRGSAPIGGHNSGRESVGTTVGNRRPLRNWLKGRTHRLRNDRFFDTRPIMIFISNLF